MKHLVTRFVIAIVLIGLPGLSLAQSNTAREDFASLSLEELMAVEIISASRRVQRADDVPAAVHVITQDDIRRSGLRTLPEILRQVAGVQVARINANNWAVSVRGSNDPYSNKLLVLVDGRSIYNRGFSGVFWNTEDLLIDDIARIEVIRGSGGSLWGANAVNGVINIVTKSAAETQGLLVRLGQDTFDGAQGAIRYGGSAGSVDYRVFSQWSDHGSSKLPGGSGADDQWSNFTNGFRVDWRRGTTATLFSGSFTASDSKPLWRSMPAGPTGPMMPGNIASERYTGSLLGRWTKSFTDGSDLQVQSFFNYREFDDLMVVAHERTADLDIEYRRKLGRRHDVVVGAGVREIYEGYEGTYAVSFVPDEDQNRVVSAFVHDEVRLGSDVRVSLGSKFEHDSVAGWGVQPTARATWDIVPSRHMVWGAVSRALRTPSSKDLNMFINYRLMDGPNGIPMLVRVLGNPNYEMEELISQEVGYRTFLRSSLSIDATVFHGHYDGLMTSEPLAPRFEMAPAPHIVVTNQMANLLDATTTGLELAAHWTPLRSWRLDGSYSAFQLVARPDAMSRDPIAPSFDGNAPAHQWQLHSTWWLASRAEVKTTLFHVARLEQLAVPAYTRADASIEFKVTDRLSMIGTGYNLLEDSHREYAVDATGMTGTLIPRSAGLQIAWKF